MINNSLEDKWDNLFRNKLKFIWKNVKELSISKLDSDLIERELKLLADDFFTSFNDDDCKIPIKREEFFYNNYHSVFIPLGSFSFLIPYKFYTIAKQKNPPNLDSLFSMPVSWFNFLSYFYETIFNTRKELKENDVRIITFLTQFQPNPREKYIPFTKQEIGKVIGMIGERKKPISENTVLKRMAYLYNENILLDLLLINPWKLGFTLKLLVYNKKFDNDMNNWEEWTKYKQIFMSENIIRIIQIPQHAEGEFKTPDYVSTFDILEFWHSNNVNQLKPKIQDSFLAIPNFETIKDNKHKKIIFKDEPDIKWVDELLEMKYSQKTRKEVMFGSLNKIEKNKRLKEAQKFLKLISIEQLIQPQISKSAKKLNLDEIQFIDFYRFFLEKKVINFATRTNYIDCNFRIGLFIHSRKLNVKDHPRLQVFLQNLIELPLVNAFIGKNIIVAYINIPIKWVGAFTTYLNILMTYEDLKIYFGLHMALQSYVKWNVPFSDKIELTKFGMVYKPILNSS